MQARILAVCMVYACKMGVGETADILMQSPRWVYNWLERYDKECLNGLHDLLKCSRSRKIVYHAMNQIITDLEDSGITPTGLQEHVREKTGTNYKTFLDMRQAISLYYRTVRFNLALFKFINRKYPVLCKNF